MTVFLLGLSSAHAQDLPADTVPRLTITRPVAPPEPQAVPRAETPQDKTADKALQDAAVSGLTAQAATASDACGTPLQARIDWSTIDPREVAGNSAANACGAALTALAQACDIAATRRRIQAEINEVICTAGSPGPALDLRAGALIYTVDWQARNPAVFIYSWLMGNL